MQNANIIDHEAFFTAGLLHDIGRLVIAKADPDRFAVVEVRLTEHPQDRVQVENDVLGVSHVDVGTLIMQNWGMPGLLTKCIAQHHETRHEGAYAIETGIVYLANRLSKLPLAEEEEEVRFRLRLSIVKRK